MSNNILAAIEPTDEGQHVWRVASRIAKQRKSNLSMINAIEPAVDIYADLSFTPLVECSSDWQQTLVNEHKAYFKRMANCLDSDTMSVKIAYPIHEIAGQAEAKDAELVVMGVHNRKGFGRLLGSTTHGVMNHCDRDILAVHPDSAEGPYQRVLVAIDTTDVATTVAGKAAEIAGDAEVHVVSVMVPLTTVFAAPEAGRGLDWSFSELTKDISRETKKKVEKTVSDAGFDPSIVNVATGDPRDEIIKAAEQLKADLIVIGSNKRGPINRLLLGSTARSVLNQAPCDVLVCRA